MSLKEVVARIHAALHTSYFTPTSQVPQRYLKPLGAISIALGRDFQVEQLETYADSLRDQGALDEIHWCSARSVIACHPKVADYQAAARFADQQELACYTLSDEDKRAAFASVHRHRGCICFRMGQFERSLEHFSNALSLQRSVENLCNVLCSLIALGEFVEAEGVVHQVRNTFPDEHRLELERRLASDTDLAELARSRTIITVQ